MTPTPTLATSPAARPPADNGPRPSSVGAAVAALGQALEALQREVGPPGGGGGQPGDLAALVELLALGDRVQATTVALAERVLDDGRAMHATGLGLEGALALQTPTLYGERRRLASLAEGLRHRPVLAALWHRGQVSTATVTAIVAETRPLPAADQTDLDRRLWDLLPPDAVDGAGVVDGDRLVEQVRDAVNRRLPARAEQDERRVFERRFVSVQPAFDGSLSFYGQLDPEGGATFLEALQQAAPRPVLTDTDASAGADTPPADDHELQDAAAAPLGDPDRRLARNARGRQLADGLVALAEQYLAGPSARRARPRLYVWTDIATLTATQLEGQAARLLVATAPGRWALTPAASRRLANDADLQFILVDGTDILGVSAPTDTIPARVRAAVTARDQGCRFPRCRAPIHWCDLHHVKAREDGGHTIVENLVALCRRHHTAVTHRQWRLTMTPNGTVTVTRGRRRHTSQPPPAHSGDDPPPPPSDDPSGQCGAGPSPRSGADPPHPDGHDPPG